MPRPLPLVAENDVGELTLCQPGVDALRRLGQQPLAALSITGTARSGKSFLVNQLVGQMDGFRVSAGVRRCTRGLWLWSEPPLVSTHDASQVALLLIDCEGLDGDGVNSERLFCLAAALSSSLIFNTTGGIDEAQLQLLASLFVPAAAAASTPAAENGPPQGWGAPEQMPALTWVLRDFSLALRDARGRPLSAAQYLETTLTGGGTAGSPSSVGRLLRQLLPVRDCVVLPRPVADERLLAQLHRLHSSTLRPKFCHAVDELRSVTVIGQ